MPTMLALAENLDRGFSCFHPKWVGRISLGPVFISHCTKHETNIQRKMDEMAPAGVYEPVSRAIFEFVVSSGRKSVRHLRDSIGNLHTHLEEYLVPAHELDCIERGVTQVKKFFLAPHRVVQILGEEFRHEYGHELIDLDR